MARLVRATYPGTRRKRGPKHARSSSYLDIIPTSSWPGSSGPPIQAHAGNEAPNTPVRPAASTSSQPRHGPARPGHLSRHTPETRAQTHLFVQLLRYRPNLVMARLVRATYPGTRWRHTPETRAQTRLFVQLLRHRPNLVMARLVRATYPGTRWRHTPETRAQTRLFVQLLRYHPDLVMARLVRATYPGTRRKRGPKHTRSSSYFDIVPTPSWRGSSGPPIQAHAGNEGPNKPVRPAASISSQPRHGPARPGHLPTRTPETRAQTRLFVQLLRHRPNLVMARLVRATYPGTRRKRGPKHARSSSCFDIVPTPSWPGLSGPPIQAHAGNEGPNTPVRPAASTSSQPRHGPARPGPLSRHTPETRAQTHLFVQLLRYRPDLVMARLVRATYPGTRRKRGPKHTCSSSCFDIVPTSSWPGSSGPPIQAHAGNEGPNTPVRPATSISSQPRHGPARPGPLSRHTPETSAQTHRFVQLLRYRPNPVMARLVRATYPGTRRKRGPNTPVRPAASISSRPRHGPARPGHLSRHTLETRPQPHLFVDKAQTLNSTADRSGASDPAAAHPSQRV